jgi:hypothetical protein
VNETVEEYRRTLRQAAGDKLNLRNVDFDTGKPTRPGEYVLTDKAYTRLLHELSEKKFSTVTPDLRANLLEFFSDRNQLLTREKGKDEWEQTMAELEQLKAFEPQSSQPSNVPAGAATGSDLLELVPPPH